MTRESALLGLLADLYRERADLYRERARLIAENMALRDALAEHDDTP